MGWFWNKKEAPSEPLHSQAKAEPQSAPVGNYQDKVAKRLKEVLRSYGVPPHWITCEVIPISAPDYGQRFQLILAIHKWNAQLLRYSLTLQQNLLTALWNQTPEFKGIEFQVFWVFSPECESPPLQIPSLASWVDRNPAPGSADRLLDRRKSPRPSHVGDDTAAPSEPQSGDGFAKTSVAPLR